METSRIPNFEIATQQFVEFLRGEKFPTDVLWVCREDIISGRKGRVYVRVPLPRVNQQVAEAVFNHGRAGGIGVCIALLCVLGCESCCYIWHPRDNMDAEYHRCFGLKLSVPDHPIDVIPIRNQLVWKLMKWWLNKYVSVEQMPSRSQFALAE